jgi:hypothetical protein
MIEMLKVMQLNEERFSFVLKSMANRTAIDLQITYYMIRIVKEQLGHLASHIVNNFLIIMAVASILIFF